LRELTGLSGPEQIDRHKATIILEAGGFFHRSAQRRNRGDRFQKALKALAWGWTFKRQSRTLHLNSVPRRGKHTMRTLLFFEYQRMSKAYAQHANLPTLSAKSTPTKFLALVRGAAHKLRGRASAKRKARLLQSQLYFESKRRHWKQYELTRSFAGAGGAGQIMAGHSLGRFGKNRNYYEPGDAFEMQVSILNSYLRRARGNMRNALAMYNGGPGGYRRRGPQSYARKILAKARW
jgi:hypothetical protein